MAQDRPDDRRRYPEQEDRDQSQDRPRRGGRRFRDERQRPESFGSDGTWDEAGHTDRPRQPYPPMTVPGAAAGYYAPYMYGSYGGGREERWPPDPGQGFGPPQRRGYGPGYGADYGADYGGGHGGGQRAPRGAPARSRSFMDRAADEVASWFGDDAAEERREEDHRGRGPRNYVRSDARIEEDVNDRLTEDYLIDARDVTVTVAEREVTLDGTVTSRAAKRRAEDIAEDVSGVVHVQNNLRVRAAGDAP